ncbi:MAG: phosphatidylserine/phosphatidylglycerophosphate/cardiolipin synthase family protein [bacterium]
MEEIKHATGGPVSGKSATPHPPKKIEDTAPSAPADSVVLAGQFTSKNKVTPLTGGDAILAETKKMITGAKSSIQVEQYLFTNQEMCDLLCQEAKRGINVQVIVDSSPSFSPEFKEKKEKVIKDLKASGCQVVMYPDNQKYKQINHVKLLIVDGKSLLIGGMNWNTDSFSNRDVSVTAEGPVVNYFEKTYADDWRFAGGEPFAAPSKSEAIPGGGSTVAGAHTNLFQSGIKPLVLSNIQKAQESIHVEMFCLTDKDVIKDIIGAHKRGVEVKVLLDATPTQDGTIINKGAAEQLKEAGIDVRWFKRDPDSTRKLHSKIGIFDGKETILGSANWTYKGLTVNREADVDIRSKKVATAFEEMFQKDWDAGLKRMPVAPEKGQTKLPDFDK